MATLRLRVDPSGAESGSARAENALRGVKNEAGRTEQAVNAASRRVAALGVAIGAAAVAFATKSVQAYREHNKALAEVSTLIQGTAEETRFLDDRAKNLAATYGIGATQQVQAFYQAISAGVGDATQAAAFLEDANRLAVGGVTDITTAVDGLTTVMNAYKDSGITAARASDVLFTGVRQGKTTIAELSASLGNVAPLAASVGVSIEEVVAAIAALTSQGQSTSTAVTGVRQAISNLIKPSSEAVKLARDLGIQFSAAALESRGLEGILEDVSRATGGNTEQMARLFGSVEALNAVLALSGEAGATFRDNLTGMENAAGAADEAFRKVSQSLEFRLNAQLERLRNIGLEVGEFLLERIVPALEFATSRTTEFGVALAGLSVAALALAPLTGAIGLVASGIIIAAANWEQFRIAGQIAIEFVSDLFKESSKDIVNNASVAASGVAESFVSIGRIFVSVADTMVSSWRGSVAFLSTSWSQFTTAARVLFESAINGVKAALNSVVQFFADRVNGVIAIANSAIDILNRLPGIAIDALGRVDFTPFETGFSDSTRRAVADVTRQVDEAVAKFDTTPFSDSLDAIWRLFTARLQSARSAAAVSGVVAATTAGGVAAAAVPGDTGFIDTSRVDDRLTRETVSNTGSTANSTRDTAGNTSDMVNIFDDHRFAARNASADLLRAVDDGFRSNVAAFGSFQEFLGNQRTPATTDTFRGSGFDHLGVASTLRVSIDNFQFLNSSMKGLVDTIDDLSESAAGLRLQPTVNVLGSFQHGGFGRIGGSGGADSQTFVGRATPGEPFAFGDFALNGIRNRGEPAGNTTIVNNNTVNLNMRGNTETPVLPNRQALRRDMNIGLERLAG